MMTVQQIRITKRPSPHTPKGLPLHMVSPSGGSDMGDSEICCYPNNSIAANCICS